MLVARKKKKKPFSGKNKTWKLYTLPDNKFFLQIYNKGPTLRECPSTLAPFSTHDGPVATAHYVARGQKQGYVTTYLLSATSEELGRAAEKEGMTLLVRSANHDDLSATVDRKYNISSRHIDLGELTTLFLSALRHDVAEFCNFRPAKDSLDGLKHVIVDTFAPVPAFQLKELGKHDLVLDGKGTFHSICPIDIGIDFSRGCVTTVTPEGTYDPSKRCGYCYAHQNAPCYLDSSYLFDGQELLERIVRKADERGLKGRLHIRLGQRTDVNVPPMIRDIPTFPNNLVTALRTLGELAQERDLAVAMPTKFPQYDPEMAKLLIAANVTVLASIAYSELEPGVIAHGFTVERRLSEALKLAEAGVNTGIYIATDITRSLEEMQDDAKRATEFFEQHQDVLRLQYLDMRITKKKDAPLIGGDTWERLKYTPQPSLFEELPGRWQLTRQHYLAARKTHPDFPNLIKNNRGAIRLCSTNVMDYRRCGHCFMDRIEEVKR